jgi:signal transduction histidine kinase/DNA-binding response OmpR family regulator
MRWGFIQRGFIQCWARGIRRWPDLPLRTKCLLLISLPALATVVMSAGANLLGARMAAAEDQLRRAFETGQEIERLRAAETEISADARGYFISADEAFAARTRSALASFDAARLRLVTLASGFPGARERLAEIGSLEDIRQERMFGDMARFRSGILSREQLQSELRMVERQRAFIEDLRGSLEADNNRAIQQLLERITGLRAREGLIARASLLLGLLGGAAMTLLFARGITGRIAALQRNIARLAAGAAPERLAGCDEIAALDAGLAGLGDILRDRRSALENVWHGVAEMDASGACRWMNRTFAEMAGESPVAEPAPFAERVHPEDRSRVEETIAALESTGRSEITVHLAHDAARASEVRMTLLAVPQHVRPGDARQCSGAAAAAGCAGAGFYVFLRPIENSQSSAAALIRAKEAAEASNRAKTEFLAKISHDIRTPLNAILGSADLLSQTPLSFDQSEYVNMFQRNCRRLVALINDFLDFARIEAGAVRVDRMPFRIREAVDDAVATFRDAAARKGIALAVEIDPMMPAAALGDPLRIQQILVNLLSNALKFTSAGRVDVNVRVLSEASAADKLLFEVSDTGPGIRAQDQDKIFARFVQLTGPSGNLRGTGLGLTICRDLAELMGGEVGVVSREGRGSTFYFSLPLDPVNPSQTETGVHEAEPISLSSSKPVRILLAEDTEDNRVLIEQYLRDQPVQLRHASDGQQAWDAVRQGERFDLILMDIDMPGMDGHTAAREIRKFQQSQATGLTPIVALSADAMQEAVRASLKAGCVAHVAKPVDRATLLKTIRRFALAQPGQRPPAPGSNSVSEQVRALIPQYLASKAQQIEEARASLASRDFGPIRRFGHNLKGTGRGYGFPPIEEMGREIERAAIEADAARIASQLDALHRFVSESAALVNF